ncbi:MAG: cysteine synthase family protein [Myxococcales bacterium]|nr:cysteine synthase family protein [Myxococcales bacterium]
MLNGHFSVLDLVGKTPLVELRSFSPKPGVRIFAKLEGQNPSGSIKDRIARGLVEAAETSGELRPGGILCEASSGNTAIALAMVARQKGYRIKVALPDGVAPSISDILKLLGAEFHWCRPYLGMKGAIDAANELAAHSGGICVGQFSNPLNVDIHYRTTGEEIVTAMPDIDVFVAGIGTGGTIMGVGKRLREHNPKVRIVGIEPKMGDKLQGLRSLEEGFMPPLLNLDMLSRRMIVDAASSIRLMQQAILAEGIFLGVSGGATLFGALKEAERMDRGNIVVMSSDSGWKYLPARPWDAAHAWDHELDEVHWW